MKTFALIKNGIVENLIVGEDGAGLPLLFPEVDAIVDTSTSDIPVYMGVGFVDGKFMPPQPFASWTFDSTKWLWSAPKAAPKDKAGFLTVWNEELGDWEQIAIPVLGAE